MFGFTRMAVMMLVLLSIIYVCLFFYWRSGAKMRLEEQWVMEGRPGDRENWVDERLSPVARRIRTWLVLLVYVLPLVGLAVFVYVTN